MKIKAVLPSRTVQKTGSMIWLSFVNLEIYAYVSGADPEIFSRGGGVVQP